MNQKPKKIIVPPMPLTPEEVAKLFLPEEQYSVKKIKGQWKDVIEKKMPNGTEKVIEDSGWNSNMIVQGMPKILGGLMKGEGTFTGGILYHAQGNGLPAWDPLPTPPTPSYSSTQLVAEYFRKPPTSISYLDPMGMPSVAITGSILIQTVLDYTEANGMAGEYIREQGLFCGTATGVPDSGIMASVINHVAKWKDSTVKITRYWNIIFQ